MNEYFLVMNSKRCNKVVHVLLKFRFHLSSLHDKVGVSKFHCLGESFGESGSRLRWYTFLNFKANATKKNPFAYQQDSVNACSKTDK